MKLVCFVLLSACSLVNSSYLCRQNLAQLPKSRNARGCSEYKLDIKKSSEREILDCALQRMRAQHQYFQSEQQRFFAAGDQELSEQYSRLVDQKRHALQRAQDQGLLDKTVCSVYKVGEGIHAEDFAHDDLQSLVRTKHETLRFIRQQIKESESHEAQTGAKYLRHDEYQHMLTVACKEFIEALSAVVYRNIAEESKKRDVDVPSKIETPYEKIRASYRVLSSVKDDSYLEDEYVQQIKLDIERASAEVFLDGLKTLERLHKSKSRSERV